MEITQDVGEITVKPPLPKFNLFEGQWLVLPALTFKNTPFKYTVNLQLMYTLAVKRYYFVAFGTASQCKDAAGLAGCGPLTGAMEPHKKHCGRPGFARRTKVCTQ